MGKKTVVIGASPNPSRYSHTAVQRLTAAGHKTLAIGLRKGQIGSTEIINGFPIIDHVDTITLYISAVHQPAMYDYLVALHPKRIIFNPGTENTELAKIMQDHDVEVVHGCTLVMLATGSY
ncbi:MAG: CoA-binding protein [Saprospiraceae bacterium]|nr:CoA-binding protein [Saprospiraceae bacterium]